MVYRMGGKIDQWGPVFLEQGWRAKDDQPSYGLLEDTGEKEQKRKQGSTEVNQNKSQCYLHESIIY